MRRPLREWTIEETVAWVATIHLSSAIRFQKLFAEHAIDGEVLFDMRAKEDWAPMGVNAFGDVRKLLKQAKRLRAK